MKSSMTRATHEGMIIVARFPRNEFPETSSGQAGAGYMTAEKKL